MDRDGRSGRWRRTRCWRAAPAGGYPGVAYAEYATWGASTRRTEATGLGTAIMFAGGMAVPPLFGLSVTAWGGYRAGYLLCAAAAAVGGILLARPQRR